MVDLWIIESLRSSKGFRFVLLCFSFPSNYFVRPRKHKIEAAYEIL